MRGPVEHTPVPLAGIYASQVFRNDLGVQSDVLGGFDASYTHVLHRESFPPETLHVPPIRSFEQANCAFEPCVVVFAPLIDVHFGTSGAGARFFIHGLWLCGSVPGDVEGGRGSDDFCHLG